MRVLSRNIVMVSTLLVTAIAVPALAQAPSASASLSTYPQCAEHQATQNEQDAAHGAFLAGKAAFDEADYQKAIDYFKDAYRRDCTKHALLSVFIARAYELKGDKAEAVNALETYLQRAPKADDVESVKRRIENLKSQIAAQPVATTPSNTSTAALPPPSASVTTPISPPPSDEPTSGGHSAGPWIVVGAGGAAIIAGVITIVVGHGKISDALSQCPPSPAKCPVAIIGSVTDEDSTGHTLEAVGAVIAGVGGAAVIGGLIWHFLEKPQQTATTFTPRITPGYAGAVIEHRF